MHAVMVTEAGGISVGSILQQYRPCVMYNVATDNLCAGYCQSYGEFKNNVITMVLICKETNWPGSWFAMAVLGCWSLVLVANNNLTWPLIQWHHVNCTSIPHGCILIHCICAWKCWTKWIVNYQLRTYTIVKLEYQRIKDRFLRPWNPQELEPSKKFFWLRSARIVPYQLQLDAPIYSQYETVAITMHTLSVICLIQKMSVCI